MTDFMKSGDPAEGNENNFHSGSPSSNQSEGGNGSPSGAGDSADDNSVVLEYNGRGFTKGDLVKKLQHGDTHIDTLVAELKEQRGLLDDVGKTLKEQVDAREVLNQIKESKQQPSESTPTNEPKAVTAEQIRQEVLDSLKAEQNEAVQKQNWKQVTEELTNRFGDGVNQKVQEAADEYGLTMAEAAGFAKTRPKAFLRLFPDAQGERRPSIPERGRVNTQALKEPASAGSSGLFKANSSKEQVQIYLRKLQEASGN